jgi:hypothetical protein
MTTVLRGCSRGGKQKTSIRLLACQRCNHKSKEFILCATISAVVALAGCADQNRSTGATQRGASGVGDVKSGGIKCRGRWGRRRIHWPIRALTTLERADKFVEAAKFGCTWARSRRLRRSLAVLHLTREAPERDRAPP